MNIRTIVSASLLTALLLVVLPGCTTTGPDVVDPKVNERTETALFAIQEGTNGEMLRYSEQNGVVSAQEYQKANGVALGRPIDAIYEAYDSLFLHDRTSGTITVLDLQTRKKIGELTGFFASLLRAGLRSTGSLAQVSMPTCEAVGDGSDTLSIRW